jgi:hypothetical protein
MSTSITVTLVRVKETKNTYRYECADEGAPIPNLYVYKADADKAKLGESITLTVKS